MSSFTHEEASPPIWRIQEVRVINLFGEFDRYIPRAPEGENVRLIYGSNGSGKSTVLRMIDAIYHRNHEYLASVPFEEMRITLQNPADGDTRHLVVVPKWRSGRVETGKTRAESLTYQLDRDATKQETVEIPDILRDIDAIDSRLRRIDPNWVKSGFEWRHRTTGEVLAVAKAANRYQLWGLISPAPSQDRLAWMDAFLPKRCSYFLGVDRLSADTYSVEGGVEAPESDPYIHGLLHEKQTFSAIEFESLWLKKQMEVANRAYNQLAQELDATFPHRVMERVNSQNNFGASREQILKHLNGVESRRKRMLEVGLLRDISTNTPIGELVDATLLTMLEIYVDDATEKLEILADLDKRIQNLLDVVNNRFVGKKLRVTPNGLEVTKSDGTDLPLALLSSGEQHFLIMQCFLNLHTQPSMLILIDEPETSMHVEWQSVFISTLRKTAGSINFDSIVATHSPDILQGWNKVTFPITAPQQQSEEDYD